MTCSAPYRPTGWGALPTGGGRFPRSSPTIFPDRPALGTAIKYTYNKGVEIKTLSYDVQFIYNMCYNLFVSQLRRKYFFLTVLLAVCNYRFGFLKMCTYEYIPSEWAGTGTDEAQTCWDP